MNFWTFISNQGILETDSPEFRRKMVMSNRFTFVCTLCAFAPLLFVTVNGNYKDFLFQLTAAILVGLSYFLSIKRYNRISSFLVYSVMLLSIFYSSILTPGGRYEYTLIPLGMAPLSFYDDKKIGIFFCSLTFLAFMASHFIQTFYIPDRVVTDLSVLVIFITTSIALFALCALFTFQLKLINADYEVIINEQKLVVENRNKDITDSITYAKRIQQAQLPKKEEILEVIPQNFVLFKPKDIVSGDFYFFHHNPTPSPNGESRNAIIAAVDCTGHGVPGAFMSIIGSEKLKEAVLQSSDTSEILNRLNKGIKLSLHQSDSDTSTRDGMDIALCAIDLKNRIVKYSGAHIPIWIIRKGQKEVEEIKATKRAIGGLTDDEQHFETHEIVLQEGDTFYIASDGYVATFGGPNGKKFSAKKFKEILLDIQDRSMEEQEKYLDNFIENWKSGIEQMDDILVIGVRV